MGNYKRTNPIFLAVLIMLFVFASFSGTSISTEETIGQGVIKEKTAKQPAKETSHEKTNQQKNPYEKAEISIKIIPAANKTFGYDILLYGRPLIHQPNIPGLPGNEGFTTKDKARKIAEFVVQKIKRNEMPPTVAIEDLNDMGVLK